jgi:hypothetical protein
METFELFQRFMNIPFSVMIGLFRKVSQKMPVTRLIVGGSGSPITLFWANDRSDRFDERDRQ